MRKIVLVLFGGLLVVGACAPLASQRVQVTDVLRSACSTFTDERITALLSAIDDARQGGLTEEQSQLNVVDGCAVGDGECLACGLAAVDQIYNPK